MPDELELELTTCAFCGSVLEWPSTGGLLWDGPNLLGYLCERCLMAGPRSAACHVRKRPCTLRDLVEHAPDNLGSDQWFLVTESVRQRAVGRESRADRLRQLDRWDLKDADPSIDAGS
jgi:hypothetical protein